MAKRTINFQWGKEMWFTKDLYIGKTQDIHVDTSIYEQLGGVTNNAQTEYSLLVSWNCFKHSVTREEGNQFSEIHL